VVGAAGVAIAFASLIARGSTPTAASSAPHAEVREPESAAPREEAPRAAAPATAPAPTAIVAAAPAPSSLPITPSRKLPASRETKRLPVAPQAVPANGAPILD
jgi:hypothetical protein